MISVSAFSGKTVAVMGLKSGLSAAEALVKGVPVWAWDDSTDKRTYRAKRRC